MTLLGRERGRLRFEEVDEGLGQRRAGAVAMSDEIERPRDLQIRHLHAVEQPGEALVHDRALGNEGDPNAGPDSLLDGLGRAHLSDHAEGGDVAADIGQGALHGFAGAGAALAHAEGPAHASLDMRDGVLGLGLEPEDRSGEAEQELAGWRRRRAAAHTVEQRQADLLFQRADVLGNGGLGQEQRFGGAGEASELSDLGEDFEAAKIHGTWVVEFGLLVTGAAAAATAAACRHGGRHETRAGLERDDRERALDVTALARGTGHRRGAHLNETLEVLAAGPAAVLVNRHRAYWPPRCT